MPEKGLIHLYYGDGKGKTSAALGLALRAAGSGKNVVIVQFLKGWKCGEQNSIPMLSNIQLLCAKPVNNKFVKDMDDKEKQLTKTSQTECLDKAADLVNKGMCDVLILDEILDACDMGVMDEEIYKKIIVEKPDFLELVITGHKPDTWLLEEANYVTEMIKHKHPYDEGINARKGIEF